MKKLLRRLVLIFMLCIAFSFLESNVFTAYAQTNNLDSELDDPVQGKMSQDDFPDPKDWEAYLMEHPEEGIMLLGDGYPDEHMHVDAIKEYTIIGLKSTKVIQQFYIGDEYLYVTQRYKDTDGTTTSTVISRCVLDKSAKTATYQDQMVLTGFGHGQTLEGYEYNGKTYFWVSCKANTAYSNAWSLQIGRIEYQENTTIDSYLKISRFADLAYANQSAEDFGSVKRVDAALSTDGSKLLFWIQRTDNGIQYSIYPTNVLNAYLDVADLVGSKYISFKDNNILKSACTKSFSQDAAEVVLPNGSNQGIELGDDGSIYIAGANIGEQPAIAIMTNTHGEYNYSNLISILNEDFNEQSEMEGVKLAHSGIYFGRADHADQTKQYLYYFPYESIGKEAIHSETELRGVKEATCEEAGYTGDTHCTGCGELLKEGEEISAKGHVWDAGVVTKKAEAAIAGNTLYTCKVCGKTKNETIPMTGITPKKGSTFVYSNVTYKITTKAANNKFTGGAVEYVKLNTAQSAVTIPKTVKNQGVTYSVTSVAANVFKNSTTLKTVSIGSNVKKIGASAFYGCKKMTKMTGASAVTTIGKQAFYNCTALKSVASMAKLTTINEQAFRGCTKLASVTLNSKVNKIGKQAFYNCKKLKKITIKTTKLTSSKVGSNAFKGIPTSAKIDVVNSKKSSYKTLLRKKGVGTKVNIY